MVDPNSILSVIAGNSAQKNADHDRYAHGNETDGEGHSSALEHSREHVASQFVGAEEINFQGRYLIGKQ